MDKQEQIENLRSAEIYVRSAISEMGLCDIECTGLGMDDECKAAKRALAALYVKISNARYALGDK